MVRADRLAEWFHQRKVSVGRMAFLESNWLVGQHCLLFTLHRSMDCHRETQARGCSFSLLVAKPGGNTFVVELRALRPARLRVHLCVRVLMDSLCPESHHPPATQKSARGMPIVRGKVSAEFKFLLRVWGTVASASPHRLTFTLTSSDLREREMVWQGRVRL